MDIRLQQFREDVKKHQALLVCVKCGSTCVDQNSINNLRCNHCGNAAFWDAKRFSIARQGWESDASDAFNIFEDNFKKDQGDYVQEMLSALEPLVHLVPESCGLWSGGKTKIYRKDFDALAKQWAETKLLMDAVFENLLTSEDSIIEGGKTKD